MIGIRYIKKEKVYQMLIGIFFIGLCVSAYRLSGFGVDPFTCMNLAISKFLNISFGTWQCFLNTVLLCIVFIIVPNLIGFGTIVNMVAVGYLADFFCWIVLEQLSITITLPFRVFLLMIGTVFASSGCALYMVAKLGIAPYDSVAFIITKLTKERVSFRFARILSDMTVIVIGMLFCLITQESMWNIVGIGTLINGSFNGPLIQYFKNKIQKVESVAQ